MSGQTLPELRSQLTVKEQRAADLIVENEFLSRGEQRRLDEIADEVGIEVRTLYNWRQKPEFIRYVAIISDRRLAGARAKADAQLMKLVEGTSNNGIPSVKGLEMYYKLIGRMSNTIDMTVHQGEHRPRKTLEEVGQGIEELHRMLDED